MSRVGRAMIPTISASGPFKPPLPPLKPEHLNNSKHCVSDTNALHGDTKENVVVEDKEQPSIATHDNIETNPQNIVSPLGTVELAVDQIPLSKPPTNILSSK